MRREKSLNLWEQSQNETETDEKVFNDRVLLNLHHPSFLPFLHSSWRLLFRTAFKQFFFLCLPLFSQESYHRTLFKLTLTYNRYKLTYFFHSMIFISFLSFNSSSFSFLFVKSRGQRTGSLRIFPPNCILLKNSLGNGKKWDSQDE